MPGSSTGGMARSRARSVEGLVSSARGVEAAGLLEPPVEGVGGQPLPQRLGSVKREDRARARLGVQLIDEDGFFAGRDVGKRQGLVRGCQRGWQALHVFLRLELDARERVAGGLRLHDAKGIAVDEEQVVDVAVALLQLELADGNAVARREVHVVAVLNEPACASRASIFSRALASGAFLLPAGDMFQSPREAIVSSGDRSLGDGQLPVRWPQFTVIEADLSHFLNVVVCLELPGASSRLFYTLQAPVFGEE